MRITVLSGSDLRRCLDMRDAVDAVETAFARLSAGDASAPLRTRIDGPAGSSLIMPASVGGLRGVKAVSVHPGNVDRGLPTIHAAVLVLDPETGAPRALLDGTWLTALRTGAVGGVAARHLAAEDADVLTVFGAGAQARTQIQAVLAVRPVREVRILSRSGASARSLVRDLTDAGGAGEVRFLAMDDPTRAVEGAGIVVTATDSATPVFPGGAAEPGTLVVGIGSWTPAMREVDDELVLRAAVVVDSREAALAEAGDLTDPIRRGVIGPGHVRAELGEVVVAGERPWRADPFDLTFFKSVGNAVQDVAVAGLALDRAAAMGVGDRVEL